MQRSVKRAFTLIELLVVIAIIAILAAILFPVFAQAREQARKITCINEFKQVSIAIRMYTDDYNGSYPIVQDQFSYQWSPPKYTPHFWGNLIQPYAKNYNIFVCPSDPSSEKQRLTDWNSLNASNGSPLESYPDTSPGTPGYPYNRQLIEAIKSNFAINWQNLCPIGVPNDNQGAKRGTAGVDLLSAKESSIKRPANMVLGTDSIWDRDIKSGQVRGGGNNSVDPPCRWIGSPSGDKASQIQADYELAHSNAQWYSFGGWSVFTTSKVWNVYGGSWPLHNGVVTTAFTDGHVKALKTDVLAAGCRIYADRWSGYVTDPDKYIWSAN